MKFKKIAKDKRGMILQEGDVIQRLVNEEYVDSVVNKIRQPVREQFPEIEVIDVTTDWKGNGLDIIRKTLDINEYKNCRVLPTKYLRDDVPKFMKLKELAAIAESKAPIKRRIDK